MRGKAHYAMGAWEIDANVCDIVFQVNLHVRLADVLVTPEIHRPVRLRRKNAIASPPFDDVLVGNGDALIDEKPGPPSPPDFVTKMRWVFPPPMPSLLVMAMPSSTKNPAPHPAKYPSMRPSPL